MLEASRFFVVFCSVLSVIIVVEYALFSPAWKKTAAGKMLMTIFTLFATTLVLSAVTIIVGLEPWVIILRVVAYLCLTVALILIALSVVLIQEVEYQKYRKETTHGQVDYKSEDA